MKTKSYLIGLLLLAAGLFIVLNRNVTAQGRATQPGCIILGFTQTFAQDENGRHFQTGLEVLWVDQGPNASAIAIQKGDPLGKAIEAIQSNSFRKEHYEYQAVVGYGWMVFIR